MRQEKDIDKFISIANTMDCKILVADIETFPMISYTWGMWKQNVGVNQIIDTTKMMSFAGKWLGSNKYFYFDNRDESNPRDDKKLCELTHKILLNTDMVVAHNGIRFDMRKIKSRLVSHGLSPFHKIKVIDTLKLNRKAFSFDSQALSFVSKEFAQTEKKTHKNFPGFELWAECMKNNLKAWEENRKYNAGDIQSTEEMYITLRGWYEGVPNQAIYSTKHKDGEHVCPNCASTNVIKKGTRKTQTGIYRRYQCNDCNAWSRGRNIDISPEQRKHVLVN